MSREYSADKTLRTVQFWLPRQAGPDARSVVLAGSFSDWALGQHSMTRLGSGDFLLEPELPAG